MVEINVSHFAERNAVRFYSFSYGKYRCSVVQVEKLFPPSLPAVEVFLLLLPLVCTRLQRNFIFPPVRLSVLFFLYLSCLIDPKSSVPGQICKAESVSVRSLYFLPLLLDVSGIRIGASRLLAQRALVQVQKATSPGRLRRSSSTDALSTYLHTYATYYIQL